MRRRRGALAAGLFVTALYLAGAALSGSLSPLARRPLLDVGAPPPPYRWVEPPASLVASNKAPESGKATLPFPKGKSQPGVFRTADSQAVIVLLTGAIPPKPGQKSAQLTLTPLAPSKFPKPSGGLSITGNVYRISATYQSSGDPVTDLTIAGELVMIYPLTSTPGRHTLVFSGDGKAWRTMKTLDSPIQQQVSNQHVTSFGYFAAALAPGSSESGESGGGSTIVIILVAAAIVVVLVVAGIEYRRRRQAAASARGRQKPRPSSMRPLSKKRRR